MSSFPRIDSPCPLRLRSLPVDGRDHCGQCHRRVHDLMAMTEAARESFLANCSGEVCVSYTLPVSRARAAALGVGLAAAMVATSALADDPLAMPEHSPVASGLAQDDEAQGPKRKCPEDEENAETLDMIVMVGGVLDPANAARVDDKDLQLADLPRGDANLFLDDDGYEFVASPDSEALR